MPVAVKAKHVETMRTQLRRREWSRRRWRTWSGGARVISRFCRSIWDADATRTENIGYGAAHFTACLPASPPSRTAFAKSVTRYFGADRVQLVDEHKTMMMENGV